MDANEIKERLAEIVDSLFEAQSRNDYLLIEELKFRRMHLMRELDFAIAEQSELDECQNVLDCIESL